MGNPHLTIDDTLIELIMQGHKKLTDELFYELIEESPDYLGTEPFLNRIHEWQDQLEWEKTNDRARVKKKLSAIGAALVRRFDDRGKKKNTSQSWNNWDLVLVCKFRQAEKILGDFVERTQDLPSRSLRRKAFEEEFPGLAKYKPSLIKTLPLVLIPLVVIQ